jgi:cystathionine gamma-lyase
MKFASKTIHLGQKPIFKQGAFGDVTVPIHLSTTFARLKVDKPTNGYEYSRSGNPTRDALEKNLAGLEDAKYAFAYSSGLAAISNCLMLLKSGDKIISIDDVYGGTRRLFSQVFTNFGLRIEYLNFSDYKDLNKRSLDDTKMLWIETPTNPLLKIVDIKSITNYVKTKNILTVVDNTFASPYFQKPLKLGADISLHSMTKYIGGHSDVVGGCIMINNDILAGRLKFLQNAVGAILSPFDSYQILKGIKTLAIRMQKHQENAKKIVSFLLSQKLVKKIYYPMLKTHPGYKIADKQMTGFGGMVSFELNTGMKESIKFLQSLKLISIAESLGAVESLIEHPASMTHASVPKSVRKKIGLSDSFIRLSIGIEDADDLLSDLQYAFKSIE